MKTYNPSTRKIAGGFVAEALWQDHKPRNPTVGRFVACHENMSQLLVFKTQEEAQKVAVDLCAQFERRYKGPVISYAYESLP